MEASVESAFQCHICQVSCASAISLHSHFLGARHRKAEEALKCPPDEEGDEEVVGDGGEGKEAPEGGEPLKPDLTLEEQIQSDSNCEPALGLEYVYHFLNRYECRLCNCYLRRSHMFMHIVGAKHRVKYLSKHHPALGFKENHMVRGARKMRRLRNICLKVEEEFGRKSITEMSGDNPGLPEGGNDPPPPPCISYLQGSQEPGMDFTNDDLLVVKPPPKEEPKPVTFLQLKADYEAEEKKRAPGRESPELPLRDKKETGVVRDGECRADTPGRPSKEEIFTFLENFDIFEMRDFHFLLKASRALRGVSDRYKYSCEREADRKRRESRRARHRDRWGGPTLTPRSTTSRAKEKSTKSSADTDQAKALPADKQDQSPVAKPPAPVATDSKLSNKKLSFRISRFAPENALVSSGALSNMQYDFVAKSRNKMAALATQLDGQQLDEDPTPPPKLAYEHLQDVQDPGPSSSKLSSSGIPSTPPLPDPAGASSTSRLFSNEVFQSSPVVTPSMASGGSVTPQVSNVPGPLNNVPHVPSSVNPSTSEQTRNPGGPNPYDSLRSPASAAPSSQDTTRSAASLKAPESHRPLGNPASPRAPFPQPLNPPAQGAPPPFLLGPNSDVTEKFFESLKRMEVPEVVQTLHKITATNPALQGIHVPSLVQYLMDSGKLKPSNNK